MPDNERVESVEVLCKHCTVPRYETLVMNQNYTVILPRFLWENESAGYEMLGKLKAIHAHNLRGEYSLRTKIYSCGIADKNLQNNIRPEVKLNICGVTELANKGEKPRTEIIFY